jgi:hypothetical protein
LVRATSPVYIEIIRSVEEMPLIHAENCWLVLRLAAQRTPLVQEAPPYRVQVAMRVPVAHVLEAPLAQREQLM